MLRRFENEFNRVNKYKTLVFPSSSIILGLLCTVNLQSGAEREGESLNICQEELEPGVVYFVGMRTAEQIKKSFLFWLQFQASHFMPQS